MARDIFDFEIELETMWANRRDFVVPVLCTAFASATISDYADFVRRERIGDAQYLSHVVDVAWKCLANEAEFPDADQTLDVLTDLAPDYDEFGDDKALAACLFACRAVTALRRNADSAPALNVITRLHSYASLSGPDTQRPVTTAKHSTREFFAQSWSIPAVQLLASELRVFVSNLLQVERSRILNERDWISSAARSILDISRGP